MLLPLLKKSRGNFSVLACKFQSGYHGPMKELDWTLEHEDTLFSHRLFNFRQTIQRDHDGQEGRFLLLDCPDWVNVAALAIDGQGRECLLLVRQYRFGLGAQSLEFPGGVVDPGEDSLGAAKRELLEETGHEASRWIHLGSVNPNAAFMTNRTHGYLAMGLTRVSAPRLDESERLLAQYIPLSDLRVGLYPEFFTNGVMLLTWHWFLGWKGRLEDC